MLKQNRLLFFYILAFFKRLACLRVFPSLGTKRSQYEIFVRNNINCLIVGKLYLNPVVFTIVCIIVDMFNCTSDKLAMQLLLKHTTIFVQVISKNKIFKPNVPMFTKGLHW